MFKPKELVLIGMLSMILLLQEEVLLILPNVQLTVFLIVLYSKKLRMKEVVMILVVYLLIDNLVMGSFNPIYTPFMFMGWLLIPVLLKTVFRKVDGALPLAFCGILFSLFYCWMYMIPTTMILHMDFKAYFIADVAFEIILSCSSFISILLLYDPCSKAFDRLLNHFYIEKKII